MPEVPAVDWTALPKLTATDLRLLWVNDWYDGPLAAVVEHAGERRLMVLHDDDVPVDLEKTMRWILFRLTSEQWLEEERWHALFEEHVGRHWCFHGDPREPSSIATVVTADADADDGTAEQDAATTPSMNRFYEPYATRTPRTLSASAATAWVDEMPAH